MTLIKTEICNAATKFISIAQQASASALSPTSKLLKRTLLHIAEGYEAEL